MSQEIFSRTELSRYSRQLALPKFGLDGQTKLKAAKVLVVGAGGLGAPLLQYLSAAGVGTIGIVDFDTVEESNLHRQVLFAQADVGRSKVEAARDRILAQNPHITVLVYNTKLTSENAFEIAREYDVIADGTDNFQTRYLVNDLSVLLKIPNVYASILQFEGQISVFNHTNKLGEIGPNYRDLFPNPPKASQVPSCSEAGVLGVLPGILGSLQANEVIKVITGLGETLSGRLFLFDALSFETRILKIEKNKNNPLTGKNPTQTELIDYEAFCRVSSAIKSIDVNIFKTWLNGSEKVQLIDVREPSEFEERNMNGLLIPMGEIENRLSEVDKELKVVIHCRSGKRSSEVIELLQEKHGFENLYNLEGGILAWERL